MLNRMEVFVSAEAQAKFERLPKVIKVRVAEIYQRLEKWPEVSGAKPLRHNLAGCYHIRTGDYRVVFTIKGETVRVTNIDNRRDVYEE
jgi:mRNA interferase RelE/StbE